MKSLNDYIKEISKKLKEQEIQQMETYTEVLYANCLAELNQ